MKGFLKFYKYGLDIKSYAALYFMALTFFSAIVGFFGQGKMSIEYLYLVEFFIAGWLLVGSQYLFFPPHKFSKQGLVPRSIGMFLCWAVVLVGGELLFSWFGVTGWWWVLYAVIFVGWYFAVWFALVVVAQAQNYELNQDLGKFKESLAK